MDFKSHHIDGNILPTYKPTLGLCIQKAKEGKKSHKTAGGKQYNKWLNVGVLEAGCRV